MESNINRLIEAVNMIPCGRVTSYGQVGCYIGLSGFSVGRILSSIPEKNWDKLAWQRVVNKIGFISSLKLGEKGMLQIHLLNSEGVEVIDSIVDMKKYGFYFEPKSDLFDKEGDKPKGEIL